MSSGAASASDPSASAGGARPALAAIWAASALVLGACALASFRLGLAQDPASLLAINGARVLLGAAAGALFATSGALRLARGGERPLRELEWFALSAGAAAGGWWLAGRWAGASTLLAFGFGAVAGGVLLGGSARWLDRPRRASNLGVALLLAIAIGAAAFSGTYARERRDFVAPVVTWLLGDLSGASLASGAAIAVLALALVVLAVRAVAVGATTTLERIALGLGVGAAGPLAFVGSMVPRTVRWLASGASPSARLAASAAAGAATVVAIDSVPRLLVGGYDFPFNVPAALLAIPIYLGWNRARLRREVGRGPAWQEWLELALIVAATLAATGFAVQLTMIIRAVT